jgi:hypothetical protein
LFAAGISGCGDDSGGTGGSSGSAGAAGAAGSSGSSGHGGTGGVSGIGGTGGVSGIGGTGGVSGTGGTGGVSGTGGTGGVSGTGGTGGVSGTGGTGGVSGTGGTGGTGPTPTAFRAQTIELRDPHVFVNVGTCLDATDILNGMLGSSLTTDGNNDGKLDLSVLIVFRPLTQGDGTTNADFQGADCTAPEATTTCTRNSSPMTALSVTSMTSGTCLGPVNGTTSNYTPGVTSSTSPCFSTASATVTIDLLGIQVPLADARVGGTYNATPATALSNGLLRGFISESDANNIIIPQGTPLVGGQPLSSLLPGGQNNCANGDDRDTGPNGARGWYFYLNYTARQVPYSE